MGINHNFREFAELFSQKPEDFREEVLIPLARFTDSRFGSVATNKYMQDAGTSFTAEKPPRPRNLSGPLRKVTGRLERAITGAFSDIGGQQVRESKTFVDAKLEGILWMKIIDLPYAAIHEYGGRIPTTQKMINYFWAKAMQTSSSSSIPDTNHWKQLALGAQANDFFVMPARPYAEPALKDVTPEVVQKGEELIQDWLSS